MLADLCFNALIWGPANFHFVGRGWPSVLSAACHHLSLDVLEQVSGSILLSFDWKISPVLYDFRVWAGQRQQ